MKKITSVCLVIVLLFACVTLFSSCSAPRVEDIYDRVVELVESSHEVNAVFYGVGMPVYHADSAYAELNHIYYDFSQSTSYEYVMIAHAKFPSENLAMEAAGKVYGKDYVEDVLSVSAFTGYAVEDSIGGSIIARARYIESNGSFCQSTEEENIHYTAMRIYDFSTMQTHSLGRSNACTVTIDSHLEDTPDQIETIELYLVKQDGEWFLDSFTGA